MTNKLKIFKLWDGLGAMGKCPLATRMQLSSLFLDHVQRASFCFQLLSSKVKFLLAQGLAAIVIRSTTCFGQFSVKILLKNYDDSNN